MIVYRTLADELSRDEQRFCGNCSEHTLGRALAEAARKGDRHFLICENCCERWVPNPADIAAAIRGWLLIFVPDDRLGAVLCPECAALSPEPVIGLPRIGRAILWESRGPMQ